MKLLIIYVSSFCGSLVAIAQTNTPTIAPTQQTNGVVKFDTLAAPTDRTSVAPMPEKVTAVFNRDHPGFKAVTWKVKNNFYLVAYVDPKTKLKHLIAYDKNGNVIQKENEMTNVMYPAKIYQYYTKTYPGENLLKVWQVQPKPDLNYYFVKRGKKLLWFDGLGEFLSAKQVKTLKLDCYTDDL